jgi:hypothetical protein
MSLASNDVQWMVIRNHHSYLVKRDGFMFSGEPLNLTNQHSYKFSGLVNNKVVGVVPAKKGVTLLTKSTKQLASRSPRSLVSVALNKHVRNHSVRAASTIQTLTAKSNYRADLTKFAVARYHALHRATKVKPQLQTQKKRRVKNASA